MTVAVTEGCDQPFKMTLYVKGLPEVNLHRNALWPPNVARKKKTYDQSVLPG